MRKILVLILSVFTIFSLTDVFAQINIPTNGSSINVACGTNTTVYDNGGPSANYSNNANGYVVLNNTAGSTAVINLSISYSYIESCCDKLRILSGAGTTGTALFTSGPSNSGTATVTSLPGQALTIRFTSDGSVVGAGFQVTVTYSGSCTLPPCSGTPNSGSVALSSTSGCQGQSVNLTTSGLSSGTGISYQWQSSPSGAANSWTDILSATGNSYSASPSVTTYYRIRTSCSGSGQSNVSPSVVYTVNNCWVMPAGSSSITTCSGTLYDNGGSGADYLNNSNGTITIYPAVAGNKVRLTFTSFSTESGWDYLYLYNGNSTFANSIGTYSGSNSPGTITSTAADGSLTVRFTSDASVVFPGFTAAISCVAPPSCNGVTNTSVDNITQSTATILWTDVVGAASYSIYANTTANFATATNITLASGPIPAPSGGVNINTMAANTTYYFWVVTNCSDGSTSNPVGPISVTTLAVNPCATITPLTCGTSVSYSLAAGNGAWTPPTGYSWTTPGNEQVFSFTPSVTGNYNIAVTNNNYFVDLFYGTTCGPNAWTYINDISTSGETNATPAPLNAGTTYYFLLDDENTTASAGTITISQSLAAPVINGLANICTTTGLTSTYSIAAVPGATNYTWSVTPNAGMILQNGGISGTYTGTALTRNINFGQSFQSGTLTVTANGSCGSSTTTLSIQRIPGGDFVVNAMPYTNSSTTVGAGNDWTFGLNSNDHAYEFTPTCSGTYNVSTCGSSFDTYLYVVSNVCAGTPIVLASNDDGCSLQSNLNYNFTAGTTYYIMVEGYAASEGSYTLNISPSVGSVGPISGQTNICGNGGATLNYSIPAVAGATYAWSVPAGMGIVGASTGNSISVLVSSAFNSGTVSVQVNGPCGGSSSASLNVARTNEDATYSNQFTHSGNTTNSGNSSSLRLSNDEIIKWDVTCPGTYTISTCGGASWDTYLYLISDLPCNAYSTIGENDDYNCDGIGFNEYQSTLTATLGAGTYYIVVEGYYSTSAGAYTLNVTGQTPAVTINSVSNYNGFGVSCNGGSNGTVSASAVNGTGMEYSIDGGASYQSSGNFSGLTAGTYTITARNCVGNTATASFTVTEPAALSVALTGSDYNGYGVSCYNSADGSVSSAVTGGVGPFTYTWNNGSSADNISGLEAGDYSVMVTDANGCVDHDNITLSEPTKVTIAATNTTILCNGDLSTITVTTGGGATPYQVNDANVYYEPAGSYTYNVVDANGCSASTSLTITQPTAIVVNAGSDETVFYGYAPAACADLSATATGGTGSLSLSWTSVNSGGAVGSTILACPSSNEVYTATAVDANGCVATDQVSICVVNVTCKSGNGPLKVEVCHKGHTICISPNAVPAHLAHGDQLGACGEAQAACGAPASKDLHDDHADELEASLAAYPNPTDNTTTISVTLTRSGNYSVELYDMMGKLVTTIYAGSFEEYENLEFDVDMSNLNTGVYMVSVMNGDQKIENIRVMKN